MKLCFSLLFIVLITSACRQEKSIEEQMDKKTTVCYRAIDQNDTAWLSIDTSKKTQIIGVLEMNYAGEKRRMLGQFKGLMSGDTLKGHYDFKVNKVDKWYRNPVAFLKRDQQLVMGVGEVQMVWGSAFFDPKVPIDYEKGRFVFGVGECK